MDLKGTWDRGGFGPKATAAGVDPASGAASGREAVPANHVRQRWESSARAEAREPVLMVRVLQKEKKLQKRERTEAKEINPTARTGERCSASQYVNKCITLYFLGSCGRLFVVPKKQSTAGSSHWQARRAAQKAKAAYL